MVIDVISCKNQRENLQIIIKTNIEFKLKVITVLIDESQLQLLYKCFYNFVDWQFLNKRELAFYIRS